MDGAVADAVNAVLDQTTGLTLPKPGSTSLQKSAPNSHRDLGIQPLSPIALNGTRGTIEVDGTYYPAPWPPRFEITLSFDNYTTDEILFLNGSLAYNFIVDDTVSPPAVHGLLRGTLSPRGSLGGAIEVRALIRNGERESMTLTSNGTKFSLGSGEPPAFLTYVSTLAGTGKAGYQDGTGNQAQLNEPQSVTVDEDGTVYVADNKNHAIREISPAGTVGTLSALMNGIFSPSDLGIDPEGERNWPATPSPPDSPPSMRIASWWPIR